MVDGVKVATKGGKEMANIGSDVVIGTAHVGSDVVVSTAQVGSLVAKVSYAYMYLLVPYSLPTSVLK